MKLVIAHYHLRPGGVRRVIELATPHIVCALGGDITGVTLASGEAPDQKWRQAFQKSCAVPTDFLIEPAFGYFSEQHLAPAALRKRIRKALLRLLGPVAPDGILVWAHNLGLGRNLLFTQELMRACQARGLPLLAHHHDWWFDNRWQRWPEARRQGCRSLGEVAQAIFGSRHAHHFTINQADATILQRHIRRRVAWLPNLNEPARPPARARVGVVRDWLHHQLRDDAPVWLLPCRLLRRKNIAEALLLARWLRPEAWLVTVGAVSSAEEMNYFEQLKTATRTAHYRIRLGILAGDETGKPTVAELLSASEAVLLTSLQEGFGLPYIEAAAARRPLIARALPNIAPDLARFGFHFPQYYEEILAGTELFDWKAERSRQTELFRTWLSRLPAAARKRAGQPAFLVANGWPESIPFSRLTLTAQLEVLAQPVTRSWETCARLNPFLKIWRQRADAGRLLPSPWPQSAARWLSGANYGRRFRRACEMSPLSARKEVDASGCQEDFIRHRLKAKFLYPLLWSQTT